MSVYDIASISLMSAPAAKTFSPPQTMTAATSRRCAASRHAAIRPCWISPLSAFIGGRSRRIVPMPSSTSRRTRSVTTVPPAAASPSAFGSMPSTRWCQMCTPDRITWIDDLEHGRRSAPRRDEVLADDDEGRAGDAGLDAVHVEVELVAGLVQVQPVGEQVLLDLPLAEDPHDLDLALGAPHEELLVVDGEGDVAVGVEVGLEPEVDEHVEDPAAQRVLVGWRREVGQRRGIGHGSNLTTH